MIYIIDEDVKNLKSNIAELKMRGFEAINIPDADEGFKALIHASDIELVLIDVMLAVHDNVAKSRYTFENAEEELTTGLQFLDDMISQRPDVFPSNVAIFTCAKEPWLFAKIKKNCEKHDIPLLDKDDFGSTCDFADKVEEILKSLS